MYIRGAAFAISKSYCLLTVTKYQHSLPIKQTKLFKDELMQTRGGELIPRKPKISLEILPRLGV